MATYLEGVEDGRRDILIRIEREAVAVYRDLITMDELITSPGRVSSLRAKLATMIGLIKQLDTRPQSWEEINDRVESEGLRQITQAREDERAAAAKAVGS